MQNTTGLKTLQKHFICSFRFWDESGQNGNMLYPKLHLQNEQSENGISESSVFKSKSTNSFKYWVDHHMHENA